VFNPSGTRLATLGYTASLMLWNTDTAALLHEERLPIQSGYNMAWSPDGAQLAITGSDPRVILYPVPDVAR
jgi:WD40 repeat protein